MNLFSTKPSTRCFSTNPTKVEAVYARLRLNLWLFRNLAGFVLKHRVFQNLTCCLLRLYVLLSTPITYITKYERHIFLLHKNESGNLFHGHFSSHISETFPQNKKIKR